MLYYKQKDIHLLEIFTPGGATFFPATAIRFTRGLSDGYEFGEGAVLMASFSRWYSSLCITTNPVDIFDEFRK